MKTPHAILIGLSLIAAAIFFKDIMTPPAHAFGKSDGFACAGTFCTYFIGDRAVTFHSFHNGANKPLRVWNWRTGENLE